MFVPGVGMPFVDVIWLVRSTFIFNTLTSERIYTEKRLVPFKLSSAGLKQLHHFPLFYLLLFKASTLTDLTFQQLVDPRQTKGCLVRTTASLL